MLKIGRSINVATNIWTTGEFEQVVFLVILHTLQRVIYIDRFPIRDSLLGALQAHVLRLAGSQKINFFSLSHFFI
ncbi:MAG TPA: hypothetical protein DCM28_02755 [Phycisphaerales bacterium]|nr:hypothetical protein [Phycisphaerales bacterium]HCD34833.1 hypothetical protein [Phycisphaerales bacterium]